MEGIGFHFALGPEEERRLLEARGDAQVRERVGEIKHGGESGWSAGSGQSWDVIHRCLSNGTLFYDEGEYPLNQAVLGGKHLYGGDDRVVAYVAPDTVKEVAASLVELSPASFRSRYDALDPDDYDGDYGEADFKAAWNRLEGIRELYRKAAAAGRSMIFTVDP